MFAHVKLADFFETTIKYAEKHIYTEYIQNLAASAKSHVMCEYMNLLFSRDTAGVYWA